MAGVDRELGKIMEALDNIKEDVSELKEDVKDLIGAKNKAMGAGMFVGGLAGIVSTWFTKIMGWA